jgi:aspartyl protease family protein
MMTISVIIGMAMLTWYFSGVEEKQRNPNAEPQSMAYAGVVEVPLKRNRQGHYLVNGYINGQEVEFLLDTGATDVVIPENIARELNLPYGQRMQAMTANGAVTVFRTRIDQLDIGEIRLRDIPASINTGESFHSILLGMSALGQVEFRQQGKVLTLRQKSA